MTPSQFTDIHAVEQYLDRIPQFQKQGASAARMGLDRMRAFCQRMADPQKRVRWVHVAGTNGKGSVCNMLARVFEQAGYRCALYTSPHLEHVRERFRCGGRLIEDREIVCFFQRHEQAILESDLTYFELVTAMAFWWFAEQQCDLAILETGLGGRLDATNVVHSEVSVITSVSHDHTAFLGTTLRQIAAEKAGIIKPGSPVVVGRLPPSALQAVRAKAEGEQAPLIYAGRLRPRLGKDGTVRLSTGVGSKLCDEASKNTKTLRIATDLTSPVSAVNVAMVYEVCRVLKDRFAVSAETFSAAFEHISASGMLPGRFERLHPALNWYVDGAHNPQAVRELFRTIQRHDFSGEPVVVLSVMQDKVQKKMLQPFSVLKKTWYYALPMERAAHINSITPFIPEIASLPTREEEIIAFLRGKVKEVVIFTGSFYLYSVVKRWVGHIVKTG